MDAGGNVPGNHGSFDGNGARTAERVQQNTVFPPIAKLDHGRSQCFFQRRIQCVCTVSAHMQTGTAGINGKGNHVFQNAYLNGIGGACFIEPVRVISLFQFFYNGFFDDCLTVRYAEQGRFYRFTDNSKFAVLRNPVCPGQCFCLVEKLCKSNCLECTHFYPDTSCTAQPHVGFHDIGFCASKFYFPVRCFDIFKSKSLTFPFHNGFQTECSCCDQIDRHSNSPFHI